MNWSAISSKAKYVIVPLACLAVMAIAITYNNTGKHEIRKGMARTGKTAPVPLDKIDPGAMENYTISLRDFFSRTDNGIARKSAEELRLASLRLAVGQISLADAHAAARNSAQRMVEQKSFHMEISDLILGTELSERTKAKKKDWLDNILEANPRKFLFVIVIILVLVILAAAILGKSEIRKAGWAIALVLIAFLVVNQVWKTASTQQLANIVGSAPASAQKNTVVVEVNDREWSREVVFPQGKRFTWDDQPGDLYFKFPNGKIVKTVKGRYNQLDRTVYRFRLKGTPGIVTFQY